MQAENSTEVATTNSSCYSNVMSLPAGTQIGPYEIVSLLGAGGMGEVYRARDSRIGREVAVKIIVSSFASDPKRLRRFEQEVRASGALNHPNILSIYDVGTHDESPYLVSELLEGQTLRERLEASALPLKKTIDYALQISRGLATAHEKGIIHRDLKPENLFVTKDGRVKILDFGLAKLTYREASNEKHSNLETSPGTESGVILGTIGYMSPEQVRGEIADHRSDIFSLGTILYEMLSGRRAFAGETAVEKMNAILKEDPPPLSQTNRKIPPAMERIVHHCLEKNSEERFRSAHDLAFALEALSEFSGMSSVSVAPETTRRRFLPVAVAFLISVAIALAFFVGKKTGFVSGKNVGEQRGANTELPTFERITFRRGVIESARFASDGHTIVYTAAWEGGPMEIYSAFPESPEARPLGFLNARILSMSAAGEMAILLHFTPEAWGTLARVPLSGGAPREILEDIHGADWSPDGKNLAVVRRVGGRNRLEFPIGKVLYETSQHMDDPRVSPAGNLVAFLENTDKSSVIVVDLAGKRRILSSGWEYFRGLAWSPESDEIWFAASRTGYSKDLVAVSLSGKERLIYRMTAELYIADISKSGRVMVRVSDSRTAINGLAPGETKERDLSWLDWSICTDLSSDGKTLLFLEHGEGSGENISTYLRNTDGTPAIRLGEVRGQALSPDGKWLIAGNSKVPHTQLLLIPTGPGESRTLTPDTIKEYRWAGWLPDGKRIICSGNEQGHSARLYVQEIGGGKPRAISPEGVGRGSISPDGKFVASVGHDQKLMLYPVDDGEPHVTPVAVTAEDTLITWSADGRSIYMYKKGEVPTRVYRADISTGRKELWKTLLPADPAGVSDLSHVVMTPDAKSYAYSYTRTLSDLYLVDGLK